MSLRNENIGLALGIVIVIVGSILTNGDPGKLEGALIAVLGLGAALWLSVYLNERDGTYSRPPRR